MVPGVLLVSFGGAVFAWFFIICFALLWCPHLKYHMPLPVVTNWFQQVNTICCWFSGLMGYLLNHRYAELKLGFESIARSIVGSVIYGLVTIGL